MSIRMSRERAFLALILAQAAHSVEEYLTRLYEVFAPARLVSGLFSGDLAVGFAIANVVLVLAGFACYFLVRKGGDWGRGIAWFWTVLEGLNGTGHLLFALQTGGYFPGAATAPLLLACSGWLAYTLRERHPQH